MGRRSRFNPLTVLVNTMAAKGNTNASKPDDQKASSFLYIRAMPGDKASWTSTSRAQGKKLSVWVIEQLNAAVDREHNK